MFVKHGLISQLTVAWHWFRREIEPPLCLPKGVKIRYHWPSHNSVGSQLNFTPQNGGTIRNLNRKEVIVILIVLEYVQSHSILCQFKIHQSVFTIY